MALNQRKVAMVGCGSSGAASCFALMQSGLFTEMVLIDSLPGHGSVTGSYICETYEDLRG